MQHFYLHPFIHWIYWIYWIWWTVDSRGSVQGVLLRLRFNTPPRKIMNFVHIHRNINSYVAWNCLMSVHIISNNIWASVSKNLIKIKYFYEDGTWTTDITVLLARFLLSQLFKNLPESVDEWIKILSDPPALADLLNSWHIGERASSMVTSSP